MDRRQALTAMVAGALGLVASPAVAKAGALQRAVRDPSRRRAIIRDGEALVDRKVEAVSGITGVVVRGSYRALLEVHPRFVPLALDALLDAWAARLDSIWEDGGADAFDRRADEVAEHLLRVVDERAEKVDSGMVRTVYQRLRPHAKPFVVEAVPDLAAILAKHVA